MWVERSVLLVAVVVAVFVALSVLVQRGSLVRRLWFFVSNIACAVWAAGIAVFLDATNPDIMIASAQVFYAAAAVIIWAFVPMAYVFFKPRHGILVPALATALPMIYVVLNIILRPSTLIDSVNIGAHNSIHLNPLGYLVYVVYFTAYSLAVLYLFFIEARTTHDAALRRQIRYIFAVYVIDFIIGATFNLYLPWIGIYSLIWIGPINILIMAVMLYWAVIRYKLFDLKELVINVLAYAVVMMAAVLAYVFAFNPLANLIFGISDISWGIHVLNITAIVILIALLPLINSLNNHLVKTLYPDGYRIDRLISKLNRAIVKNHDTSHLLVNSARLMNKALGTRFISFVIMRHPQHILVAGSPRRAFTKSEATEVARLVRSTADRIIFVDALPETSGALSILRYHHIAMIVRIKYQSDSEEGDTVGYMMISHKVKNRGFVQRDVELLLATSGLMALAIENANYYQQIRNFNENLRQEIAVATSRLRNSNRKLHKLDEAKDEFLSMASHQLRTPLTSVKGYLSMMLEGDAGKLSAVQRHFLSEAYQSSNNMVRIINDLLSVSRIQTGKFALDKTSVDVAKLVQEEAGTMVDSVVARDLKIAVNIDEGDYNTNADDLKLRQIVANLIDNALYYSNPRGMVAVNLSREGRKIVFKVIDNGIGVPKDELPSLFTKFQRASNARKRRPDGTGVGLFLVKRVAKEHGGEVFVESQEGKGSTFGFWIPK